MDFKHLLVATDFGDCSRSALDLAVDMARRYGAGLTILHSFELPYGYANAASGELMMALQGDAETAMGKVLAAVRAKVPEARGVVRCGSPWEQVLDAAERGSADLIVIGSHGRKGLPRALLGSVAEKVVRLSKVPVLVVHGSDASRKP